MTARLGEGAAARDGGGVDLHQAALRSGVSPSCQSQV
mgnify:CR=1 FL=1